MKYLKICFVALVVSCNSNVKKAPQMPGTYIMVSQTVNDGARDTKNTDLKQLKIYTDSFMMYTEVNPVDSVSGFGVGTYTSDTSGVTENVIYSSRDSSFDDTHVSYKLSITTTPDGYKQFIPNIVIDSQKSKLTEEYQKVGTPTKTPLDGVWKETESYIINKNDTVKNNRTQYKAFNNGYFMFGQTVKDASSKIRTGIGFGTFVMEGDHKIKETDLNSTYAVIAGQSFTIDIELNGTDHYQQTISNPDGSKSIEIYDRLK